MVVVVVVVVVRVPPQMCDSASVRCKSALSRRHRAVGPCNNCFYYTYMRSTQKYWREKLLEHL